MNEKAVKFRLPSPFHNLLAFNNPFTINPKPHMSPAVAFVEFDFEDFVVAESAQG